jgi:hypothetical protein
MPLFHGMGQNSSNPAKNSLIQQLGSIISFCQRHLLSPDNESTSPQNPNQIQAKNQWEFIAEQSSAIIFYDLVVGVRLDELRYFWDFELCVPEIVVGRQIYRT